VYQSLYDAQLLCAFNVAIKGLSSRLQIRRLYGMMLSVCLFVRLFPVKFVKLFAAWQHLAANGGLSYRVRYTCLERLRTQLMAMVEVALSMSIVQDAQEMQQVLKTFRLSMTC